MLSCAKTGREDVAADQENLPELKIGVDILKPFFYKDENGNYAGIDAEIATEACRLAGYRPVFVEIPWAEKDDYLQNGTVDCLWTAFAEDGREDKYAWTDSYMQSRLRVIVDEKSPDTDLSTYKGSGGIAVRAGSKSEETLLENQEYTNSKVYSCSTFSLAQTAFIKGYADGLACHEEVLKDMMEEYPGMYHYLNDTLTTVHLGVAFQKESGGEACQKINAALDAMRQDGTLESILQKYEITEEGESDE